MEERLSGDQIAEKDETNRAEIFVVIGRPRTGKTALLLGLYETLKRLGHPIEGAFVETEISDANDARLVCDERRSGRHAFASIQTGLRHDGTTRAQNEALALLRINGVTTVFATTTRRLL